jgi:hypothetical protein
VGTLLFIDTILSASLIKEDETDSTHDFGKMTIPPSLLDHLSIIHNISQLQAIQVFPTSA